MPVLFVMRHAESDMNAPDKRDIGRILNANGRIQAKQAAQWIAQVGPLPARIVCSPASRTLETARIATTTLDLAESVVLTDRAIYEAHHQTLLQVIARHGLGDATLLVGHHPGVSSLVGALLGSWPDEQRRQGFPPATVCKIAFDGEWAQSASGTPHAVTLVDAFRPG
jgi:phosphohistidine phosphatase SixA